MTDGPIADTRTDEELVAAVNAGNADAFEVLYRRHRDWVVRLACRFTSGDDEALDVLQETFIYFLGKFPGFRLTARLTTFLYPAVKNIALNRKRKLRRMVSSDEALQTKPAADPGPDPERSREELEGVLDILPDGQREVVLLRFVDDLSLDEIGVALSIPLGTVKSRLHNALRTLREDPRTQKYFLE